MSNRFMQISIKFLGLCVIVSGCWVDSVIAQTRDLQESKRRDSANAIETKQYLKKVDQKDRDHPRFNQDKTTGSGVGDYLRGVNSDQSDKETVGYEKEHIEFKPGEHLDARTDFPYHYRFQRFPDSGPDHSNSGNQNLFPPATRSEPKNSWIDLLNSVKVPSRKDNHDGKWRFEFQPYIWLTLRAKGSLRVDPPEGGGGDGINVEIDLGPKELFSVDQLFSASGRLEARRKRFGIIFDAFYLGVGVNTETTFLRQTVGVQVDADTFTFDGAVSYRFGGTHPFRGNPSGSSTNQEKKGWVEPFGGARIRIMKISTRVSPGSTFENTNSWIEPLIGVTAGAPISDKLVFDFRVDYSGFGIDRASNYTYNMLAGIDWRISKNGSLKLAYRRYGTKFERVGRNGRPRAIDITTDGLWIGFALRF